MALARLEKCSVSRLWGHSHMSGSHRLSKVWTRRIYLPSTILSAFKIPVINKSRRLKKAHSKIVISSQNKQIIKLIKIKTKAILSDCN